MKKILLLLFNMIALTYSAGAQTNITKVSLPSVVNDPFDIIPRNFFKTDNKGNVWLGFGGMNKNVNGNQEYFISPIGLAKLTIDTPWTVYNTSNSDIVTNDVTSIDFQNNITWIGSNAGLIKFDGVHFSVFNSKNSGIASDTIKDVSVSGTTIWLATNRGVSKFDGNTFTNFDTSNSNLKTNMCTKIIGTSSSSAYVGSNIGLFNINGNIVTYYNSNNSGLLLNVIKVLHVDINNTLWISADRTALDTVPTVCIHYLKNGVIRNLGLDELYFNSCEADLPYRCESIISDKQGSIYFIAPQNSSVYSNGTNILKLKSNTIDNYRLANISINPPNGNSIKPTIMFDNNNNLLLFARPYNYFYKINLQNINHEIDDYKFLDVNSVALPSSILGYSPYNSATNKHHEVPKGSCKKTIYSTSIWIGGIANRNLHLAAQTYSQNGWDFYSGPLDTVLARVKMINPSDTSIIKQNSDALSKTWKINKWEIDSLITNYANGNISNGKYKITDEILTWPTRGTGRYDRNYAPYIDTDNDGIYNPFRGDYPEIKGDQMVFNISNDVESFHTESGGAIMGIEMHASFYAYKCNDFFDNDSNSLLNYVTFTKYDIFNRSNNTYDSVRVGIWVDNDLGYYGDDFVGCNPKENYSFCYNGDDFDEGATGYGVNPPVSTTLLLKTPTDDNNHEVGYGKFVYYYNDFSKLGNPTTPCHFYNYMNGKWKDGSQITYGGNGYNKDSMSFPSNGATSDAASFMFPGINDIQGRTNWDEESAGNNPGDRRSLNSTNMFSFKPGEKKTIEYATVHTRANRNNWKSQMAKDIATVKRWYKDNSFPSCGRNSIGINDKLNTNSNRKINIYPNPNAGQFTIELPNTNERKVIRVYDVLGKMLKELNTNEFKINVNLEDYYKGMYIVKVDLLGGSFTSKIILE